VKLESNPEALHLPARGLNTDHGVTRCGAFVSRVSRITKYPSLVTCMTCIKRMNDWEAATRRPEPEGC
jgi:hypothetical protein